MVIDELVIIVDDSNMLKKKFSSQVENLIGWAGAACTLIAYLMVSFGLMHPKELTYQVLNLAGAIGLGTICYFKKTYQPLFVNIIWASIAALAILNIVLSLDL